VSLCRGDSPPCYSITSSARASSVAGTSRPSKLVVLRFKINKSLEGKATGRSAGLAPLRGRARPGDRVRDGRGPDPSAWTSSAGVRREP
jgi:hypothetical protein